MPILLLVVILRIYTTYMRHSNQRLLGALVQEGAICDVFDVPDAAFRIVLMLAMGFTVARCNTVHTENVFDFLTGSSADTVANKYIHSTTIHDIFLWCMKEILISGNAIDINEFRIMPNEYLGSLGIIS